jgi:hypothetical protein
MTLKQRRETMHSRIAHNHYSCVEDTIHNFIKLFIIDQGAIDTLSKDEWSHKIANAIHWKKIRARILNGEKLRFKDM